MNPSSAIESVATSGLLGSLVVIIGFLYWMKDRELSKEREDRRKDGQATLELVMKIQDRSTENIHKLAELMEWAEKRDAQEPVRRAPSRGGSSHER